MKIIFPKILFCPLAFIFCIQLNAQRFDSLLKRLKSEYPQEKLYLQFDKTIYNPGETIFFKVYLFAGNYPSMISKTVYTEFTDSHGKVLQRIVSPVIRSGAAGSIEIPADTKGSLFVRSYTKWMLNFDSSFLYQKVINVVPSKNVTGKITEPLNKTNPATSPPTPLLAERGKVVNPSQVVVQFFPEGGDLVQGVESRIAFKATDRNGIPVSVSGNITDSKGKKITPFASVHDGMGMLTLKPEPNEQYKAVWGQEGQMQEILLPAPKANGIVLEANNLISQVEFRIRRQEGTLVYPFVYVVAQMNQQMLFRAKVNIGKTTNAVADIPIENLPAGIIQITVFTPDDRPVAERILFANSSGFSFSPDLNIPVKDVDKRKKNTITINVPDTLSCNFSVAITDADINSGTEPENIYSRLLLSSDIRGYINNPAYYFSSDADSVAGHLDLVMMTNGWRRFNWKDALAGHFPELKYTPENYLAIEGQVHGINKNQLQGKEINGILELKSRKRNYMIAPVLPDGKFTIPSLIFYDTARFYYQFNKDKNKTLTSRATFDIKSNTLKQPIHLTPERSFLLYMAEPDTLSLIKNDEVFMQVLTEAEKQKIKVLKTIEVTAQKKTKKQLIDEEYTSGPFSEGDSKMILPEDDPAFASSVNLLTYLEGRVAGLQVNPSVTENAITWHGLITSLFVNEISQQSIGFDSGSIVEDASYILSIPMGEIAMVKIFEPPFIGAWGAGGGGAIAVYLKKGSSEQFVKGLDYIAIPGYSPVKEFYSPDYSLQPKSDVPDYRTTLYWNPFLLTDKDHRNISLTFYNNDITKKMKIILEGCNEDGKLTRIEKIIQ